MPKKREVKVFKTFVTKDGDVLKARDEVQAAAFKHMGLTEQVQETEQQ